jgi:hypothetical protein
MGMMAFKNAEKSPGPPMLKTCPTFVIFTLLARRNDGLALTLTGLPHRPPLHYSDWNENEWMTSRPRPAPLLSEIDS